jgi:hypothetical protein
MLGWTMLLLWAYQRPLERRAVAALTIVVIAGLVVAEIWALRAGVLEAGRMAPTFVLQSVLLGLFAVAFYSGRALAGKPSLDIPPGTLSSILKQAGLKRRGADE